MTIDEGILQQILKLKERHGAMSNALIMRKFKLTRVAAEEYMKILNKDDIENVYKISCQD